MGDDLRQVELRVKVGRGEQVVDLPLGIGVRVGPPAERDRVIALTQHLPQLPGVLDRSRRADGLVAAEDDERGKPALVRALGVRRQYSSVLARSGTALLAERARRCRD